jgi:ribonuclease HI
MQAKVLFMLWRVWHHRNNIVHGDGKASVSASVTYLVSYQLSFSKTMENPSNNSSTTGSVGVCPWTAPPEGSIIVNVDAGWDSTSKNAVLGIIVRDHNGKAILSEWRFIIACATAEEAEMLAFIAGLKHLIDLGRWPAIIESDCLRVIQTVASNSTDYSGGWALFEEARELLRVYQDISISKVDRVNNGIAHVLAHLGKSGYSELLRDSTPSCVLELITHDCNLTMLS